MVSVTFFCAATDSVFFNYSLFIRQGLYCSLGAPGLLA